MIEVKYLCRYVLLAIAVVIFGACSDPSTRPIVSPDGYSVAVSESGALTEVSGGRFGLDLIDPGIAIRSVVVNGDGREAELRITVDALEGVPSDFDLPPGDDVYQVLQIVHDSTELDTFSNIQLQFDVAKEWLEDLGHEPDAITLERLDEDWQLLPTIIIGSDENIVNFLAETPGLSLFAITVRGDLPRSTVEPTSVPVILTATRVPILGQSSTPGTSLDVLVTPTSLPEATVTISPRTTTTSGPFQIPTDRAIPTLTNTPIPSITPTATLTPTPTPTPTFTPSPTGRPSVTPMPTLTHTPVPTATFTPSPTATLTPVPTVTSSPSPTQTLTPTRSPSATLTQTPASTPTPTPVTNLIVSPTPTSSHAPSNSSTPTSLPIQTPTPTRTATPTVSPTATATLTPTPTRTATPTPTSTPVPLAGDERFAVVVHTSSKSDTRYFLENLGVKWYLDFNTNMSQVPDGAQKVPFISVPGSPDVWNSGKAESIESLTDQEIAELGFLTRPKIRNMALTSPNSYWYIFGEANRYGFMTGARFAPVFHYFYTQLKIGDPDAKIIGTSLLNWDFTCIGCPGLYNCDGVSLSGYQCGKTWFKEFVAAYESRYGAKPPVDIWAIDVYPLDWWSTPNSGAHAEIAIDQLTGMRAYLNTISEYKNTPIWITEIGLHVGYDGWSFDQQGNIFPVGNYRWDKMSDYVVAVLDWLELNGSNYKIEKWFPLTTWEDIVNLRPGTGYMGIIFFDGPNQGASLNCLGEIYRARSLGGDRLRCDAVGATITDE